MKKKKFKYLKVGDDVTLRTNEELDNMGFRISEDHKYYVKGSAVISQEVISRWGANVGRIVELGNGSLVRVKCGDFRYWLVRQALK